MAKETSPETDAGGPPEDDTQTGAPEDDTLPAELVDGSAPWPPLLFRGAGISGDWHHIPAPPWSNQQVDQVGPSGRSYHFRQDEATAVHPDDAAYFLGHAGLRFEPLPADEA